MSKLIEQYGTRYDGVKINFIDSEMPLDTTSFQEFVSITRKVEMTKEEFTKNYPHLSEKYKIK